MSKSSPSRLSYRLPALLLLAVVLVMPAHAVRLEGTGQAMIRDGNVEEAREQARRAALRDVSLQYEARVNSEDTVEDGQLTRSRLTVASRSQARDVRILHEREHGNLLRVTLEAEMSDGGGAGQCQAGGSERLRKRVAVAGFPILYPDQARIGRLDDAGEILPQNIQAALQREGNLQVFGATSVRLFGDLLNAPTRQLFDNRLTNVSELARELDAQFVVTGIIRDMAIEDPEAWGSSVLDRVSRGVGLANQNRRFVVDLMIYDGFSGSPIHQQRFSVQGKWDAAPKSSVGFGSAGFQDTSYGRAVTDVMQQMTKAVGEAVVCQPFITRITRVEGQKVTLAAGAASGLRPGDELSLYRSYNYFDSPGATPELRDADVALRLDGVYPDFSNGLIPEYGAIGNIQRDDIAIIW